nr:putative ribonuclease H-like domain-containing protein [Tanacetum cinerariifolium]
YSPPETGLVVSVFQKGDDPIDAINHMMSFLTVVVTSRLPATNNHLRTSFNPHQQATINNGRVTIQPIQGRQNSMSAGSSRPFASGSGGASGRQRVIVCYNCKGEGHMSKKCTKPKRKRDAKWFKDKALGFQNPCYLKKAQQLKPKLYDGSVIEKSDAIVIPDTEETLMLAEEIRSKMIEKQNDPKMTEKKVITKLIDNAIVNQLLTDFETRFVPQTELSVQTDEPNLSALASFDIVVKERTTTTAITKGTWVFEHTKACFRDDIIPFVKALKELFTLFYQCLIDEVTEVQNVFKQMKLAVEQHCEEKNKFQNKKENVLQENDRLLTQALSVDIMNVVVHDNVKSACLNVDVYARCRNTLSSSESVPTFTELFKINDLKAQAQAKDTVILKLKEKLRSLNGDVNKRNVKREVEEIETLNIELDHKVTKLVAENEQLKQTYKQLYDSIKSSRVRSKEQCDDLINKVNLKSAEVSDLNASLQEKVLVRLKVPVRHIRTDNGTEFVNQMLRDYCEEVGISHETSVARSPQQNGVVERHNHTLIEAARTMLIYAQAPLFLWAEVVATAYSTQNRSIIHLRHGKTPYELLHSKLPDLSFSMCLVLSVIRQMIVRIWVSYNQKLISESSLVMHRQRKLSEFIIGIREELWKQYTLILMSRQQWLLNRAVQDQRLTK